MKRGNKEVLGEVENILKEEPIVKEIREEEAIFVGDIHGDLKAFKKIREALENTDLHFIFLGDYVDRGEDSVEVIQSLFKRKVREPERITLLRGNHETPLANERYGFKRQVRKKFPNAPNETYRAFNETFAELPIAATLDQEKVIAMHGGIPKNVESIADLKEIEKGVVQTSRREKLLQVLWNDPKEGIKYFSSSMRGPGIFYFGKKAFEDFMAKSSSNLLIRAHLAFPEGVRYYFNHRLVSIFSTLSYKRRKIQGKVLHYRSEDKSVLELSKLKSNLQRR